MEQELKEKLQKHGIIHLPNISSFEENIIKYENGKIIPAEKDNDCNKLVLFDNLNYNETYLIDVLDRFICNEENTKYIENFGKFKIYYCDDLKTRVLYSTFFKYGNMKFANELYNMYEIIENSVLSYDSFRNNIEKDVICPSITLSKIDTAYTRTESKLSILSEQDFIHLSEKSAS